MRVLDTISNSNFMMEPPEEKPLQEDKLKRFFSPQIAEFLRQWAGQLNLSDDQIIEWLVCHFFKLPSSSFNLEDLPTPEDMVREYRKLTYEFERMKLKLSEQESDESDS